MAPVAVHEDGEEEELSMSVLKSEEEGGSSCWMMETGAEGSAVIGVYGDQKGPISSRCCP